MAEVDGLLLLHPDPRLAVVYPDDIVCKAGAPGVLGRVCCMPLPEHAPDSAGAAGSGAEAHVFWLAADGDAMEKVDELCVLDRALLHGDLVSNAEGRIGARAYANAANGPRPPSAPGARVGGCAPGERPQAYSRPLQAIVEGCPPWRVLACARFSPRRPGGSSTRRRRPLSLLSRLPAPPAPVTRLPRAVAGLVTASSLALELRLPDGQRLHVVDSKHVSQLLPFRAGAPARRAFSHRF